MCDSILHGRQDVVDRFLDPCADGPVVLQVAGRSPERVYDALRLVQNNGFTEINLNCGCPSPKASGTCYGAALMKEPELVRDVLVAAKRASDVDVTVKCRLGVDDCDSYEDVYKFVDCVRQAGVKRVAVHARKCLLSGLNTKKNRSVPPLKYDWVNRLCDDFLDLTFEINGGLNTLDQAQTVVDAANGKIKGGVMIGRGIWHDPLILAEVDERFYPGQIPTGNLPQTRRELLETFADRFDSSPGFDIQELMETIQPVFFGTRVSRLFRRTIHDNRKKHTNFRDIVQATINEMPEDLLDRNIRSEEERYVKKTGREPGESEQALATQNES